MNKIEIKRLIPQRNPILMIDELTEVVDYRAKTMLTVQPDNYFIDEDRRLAEPGIIEHIAQSASAFAGYKALTAGANEPPVGYIGEIKKFQCFRRPKIGETLHTNITMEAEAAGVTILSSEVFIEDELVAKTQMKIFVKSTD